LFFFLNFGETDFSIRFGFFLVFFSWNPF